MPKKISYLRKSGLVAYALGEAPKQSAASQGFRHRH
jgi:hypothetical protein